MFGLPGIDFWVLIVYLLGITALGLWVGLGSKTTRDFFMPRKFGKALMIMNAFGTGTASDQAVSVAAGTARSGLSGIWYQWLWLFSTPFYWLIAPIFRRCRAVTTSDVYELRFDRSVAGLFAVVGIASLAVKIGLLLKGTGALVAGSTGGVFPADAAILITASLFLIYGIGGGLRGAVVTDAIQGVLTIIFSFMLLPVILWQVNGITGVQETIDDPGMLSLVAPGRVTLFFIIMMAIQALVGIVAQPFIMGVTSSGKTEFEGRTGMMFGNIIKRVCTMAWSVTAIAGVAWYLQNGFALEDIVPDELYGSLAQIFLPEMFPGALGLFLAAMLAGVMSSCDAYMLSSSALFSQNVYRPLRSGKSESHYLFVGRIVSVLIVAAGIAFALWVPDVITALEIWFMVAPMMGMSFWLGLLWRRLTVAGAWSITLVGFTTWFVVTRSIFVDFVDGLPFADALNMIWRENGAVEIYLPWQIVMYMAAAITAGVVVSLFTRPVSEEKLKRFYDLTRTPIAPNEQIVEPCRLPEGVEPAERRMLVTAFGLEIPAPSFQSLWGFALGWACVIGLVLGFMWLWR